MKLHVTQGVTIMANKPCKKYAREIENDDARRDSTMPKGPQGQRRPADVIGAAVMVARISVGDEIESLGSRTGRHRSGIAGAAARNDNLASERRREIAALAANARWAK